MKKGSHHSEEALKKMSERMKGKNNPMYGKRFYGKDNPNYGNHNPKPSMSKEKHWCWKGDQASYSAIHTFMRKYLPIPENGLCEECNERPFYDTACITGNYSRDPINWKRVCRKCHRKIDAKSYIIVHEMNRQRPRIKGKWI